MAESELTKTKGNLPNPLELAKEAWVMYKKRFWTVAGIGVIGYLGILAILLVSVALGAGFFFLLGAKVQSTVIFIGFLLGIIVILSLMYISTWMVSSIIVTMRDWDKHTSMKENIVSAKPFIVPMILTSLLAGFIGFGSFFLFVIPSIIIGIWFGFAEYVVVTENRSGLSALHTSRELVRGRFWGVVWRSIAVHLPEVIIGFVLASSVRQGSGGEISALFRLASLLAIPFYSAYAYTLFKHLRDTRGEVSSVIPTSDRRLYFLLPIAGYLMLLLTVIFVVPSAVKTYQKFFATLKDSRMEVQPGTVIVNGLIQYYADNNEYPATLTDVDKAGYLDGMDMIYMDPKEYRYTLLESGQDFRLCTPVGVNPEKCVTSTSDSFDL